MSDTDGRGLKETVESHFWWHSIDLGNGLVTPGRKRLDVMQAEYGLTFGSLDLAGKTVLDAGAWNGGFSIEAARRGARHVTGLDHATWNNPDLKGRDTFELAVRATGLDIRAVDMDLDAPNLSLRELGTFDVVLFLGVFYHLKDPIAATRELAAVAREAMVLETHVEFPADPRPSMLFYPGAELNNDGSNWWGPNTACVVELLKMFGFRQVDVSAGSDDKRQVFHAFR